MSAVRNYQKELDKITGDIKSGSAPTLFLHSCCAPCSSYVLEYLRQFFRITVFYYNPNITEAQEYRKRVAEQKRLIAAYNAYCREAEQAETGTGQEQNTGYLIDIVEGDYEPACFYEIAKGLEQCPEGGERCFACYALRLRETEKRARAG